MEAANTNNFYRECLRNHAANLGGYAADGCGEFMLDQISPIALLCAACGCHRNFHRKIKFEGGYNNHGISHNREASVKVMVYNGGGGGHRQGPQSPDFQKMSSKKRPRTKFTQEQKKNMHAFAEKLGWKLVGKDPGEKVETFCTGIGVTRRNFKVWMQNHKGSSSAI